jgi:hypothetical protein
MLAAMANNVKEFWPRKILMQALACSHCGGLRREPNKIGSLFIYRPAGAGVNLDA